jgi:hypothetical protein
MNLVLTKKIGAYFGVMVLSMGAAFSAHSAAFYSGQITGTWSTAVTSGTAKEGNNPAITYPTDNSSSAYCNLSDCPNNLTTPAGNGATLIWGDSDNATPPSSTVIFKGSSFSNVRTELRDAQGKITQASDIFQLGTLTYTNGTSGINTLIFGSTLTLNGSLIGTTEKIDPFVIQLGIDTTLNSGTPEQNADFLFFGNKLGTTAPVSFNVYEGQTATAIVWGRLVGDPVLLATGLTLAPGSTGAGFIANGAITSASVPAPNALALILVGFLALSFGRIKKA